MTAISTESRNWTVKADRLGHYYLQDDDESSEMLFTPQKRQAERFTLAEAEHFIAVAQAQGYALTMVSAGGEG